MPPSYLVLCGPMGAGKSTVGARLASVVGCPFDDLDVAVEQRAGRSAADIFARDGESSFRRIEQQCALELLAAPAPRVVALGGGTLTSEAVRERCRRGDVLLVWLRIAPETAMARLGGEAGAVRPLWRQGGVERWTQLAQQRAVHWAEAAVVLDVDAVTADVVAERVLGHWEVFRVR